MNGLGGHLSGKRIVVAVGGNSIPLSSQRDAADGLAGDIETTCRHIVDLIRQGYCVVMTHGNGPQVGNILIQQESGEPDVPGLPMDICGAMSQGQLGYALQQTLNNILRDESINRDVLAITTQVNVDREDPAFENPTKPVGPYYDLETKERMEKRGYLIREVKPGTPKAFRRVVPSPNPLRIIEARTIKKLVDSGTIVIAAGGGGIPVVMDEQGHYRGISAVLDKDLTGERLAETVAADILMILTDVEKVYLNFNTPRQKALDAVRLAEIKAFQKEGHFAAGSMGPKVEACVRFLEFGGQRAIITSLDKSLAALRGETGTHFIP
jgi:carbamate kinase